MMKKLLLWIIILAIGSIDLIAQTAPAYKLVTFKGKVNAMHAVLLELEMKAEESSYKTKGLVKYERTRTVIEVFGRVTKDSLFLSEVNEDDQITGYWKGVWIHNSKELKHLTVEWVSADNSLGADVDLQETKEEKPIIYSCELGKWLRHYKTKTDKGEIDMYLACTGEGRLSGTAYYEENKKSYKLVGEWNEEKDDFIVLVEDTNWKSKDNFEGKINDKKELVGISASGDTIHFLVRQELAVSCLEFMDYYTTIDITFPNRALNSKLNEYLASLIEQNIKNVRKYAMKINDLPHSPQNRASVRAYNWWQIDYFSENILSGTMTFSTTQDTSYITTGFNYDIQNSREIKLEDIVDIKNKNFERFKNDFIRQEVQKKIVENTDNREFNTWIKEQKFEIFSLRRDGIIFSTRFNSLFGCQTIIIPYDVLTPYLKRKINL